MPSSTDTPEPSSTDLPVPSSTELPVPSSTESQTSAPSPTGAPSGGINPAHFFPVPFKKGFTTLPKDQVVPQDSDVTYIEPSDDALAVQKVATVLPMPRVY